MDDIDENDSKTDTRGFFKHVFNFNKDSKHDMLNILQYALLAIIPVIIINKLMQKYIPEADEDKGSLELVAEVVAQVIIMFMSIFFIHRIITYIPTYSGSKYGDFNVTNIILAVLIIVLSLQTKLGEKISILVNRLTELWDGKPSKKVKKNVVKTAQPITQGQSAMFQSLNVPDSHSTSIQDLPQQTQQMPQYTQQPQQQENPYDSGGIMAANEVIGGSFGANF
jgi:hypothetical protein